jgi:hypothetical protein
VLRRMGGITTVAPTNGRFTVVLNWPALLKK